MLFNGKNTQNSLEKKKLILVRGIKKTRAAARWDSQYIILTEEEIYIEERRNIKRNEKECSRSDNNQFLISEREIRNNLSIDSFVHIFIGIVEHLGSVTCRMCLSTQMQDWLLL
jgi:hypothetical protein